MWRRGWQSPRGEGVDNPHDKVLPIGPDAAWASVYSFNKLHTCLNWNHVIGLKCTLWWMCILHKHKQHSELITHCLPHSLLNASLYSSNPKPIQRGMHTNRKNFIKTKPHTTKQTKETLKKPNTPNNPKKPCKNQRNQTNQRPDFRKPKKPWQKPKKPKKTKDSKLCFGFWFSLQNQNIVWKPLVFLVFLVFLRVSLVFWSVVFGLFGFFGFCKASLGATSENQRSPEKNKQQKTQTNKGFQIVFWFLSFRLLRFVFLGRCFAQAWRPGWFVAAIFKVTKIRKTNTQKSKIRDAGPSFSAKMMLRNHKRAGRNSKSLKFAIPIWAASAQSQKLTKSKKWYQNQINSQKITNTYISSKFETPVWSSTQVQEVKRARAVNLGQNIAQKIHTCRPNQQKSKICESDLGCVCPNSRKTSKTRKSQKFETLVWSTMPNRDAKIARAINLGQHTAQKTTNVPAKTAKV